MEEDLLDADLESLNVERPTFLTVICILTFIGSGFGLLGGLAGLTGSAVVSGWSDAPQTSVLLVLMGIVAAGLCLFGAIQMWNLKKLGFTLYLTGSILSVGTYIVNVMTMSIPDVPANKEFNQAQGEMFEGMFSAVLWLGLIFTIAINLTFVLMYYANRKYLK